LTGGFLGNKEDLFDETANQSELGENREPKFLTKVWIYYEILKRL